MHKINGCKTCANDDNRSCAVLASSDRTEEEAIPVEEWLFHVRDWDIDGRPLNPTSSCPSWKRAESTTAIIDELEFAAIVELTSSLGMLGAKCAKYGKNSGAAHYSELYHFWLSLSDEYAESNKLEA